ncbi:MAG TPA: twin transmembrane helix small protein [Gammaproteobacteria bacterium]|nr:twin transmembrane helix small protein [Gammaproteobacteria bacterium]
MLPKILILSTLAAIVFSLGTGMFFLVRDKGTKERTVRALTWRITLSVSLFALIMLGISTGYIKPHGLYAPGHPVTRVPATGQH